MTGSSEIEKTHSWPAASPEALAEADIESIDSDIESDIMESEEDMESMDSDAEEEDSISEEAGKAR